MQYHGCSTPTSSPGGISEVRASRREALSVPPSQAVCDRARRHCRSNKNSRRPLPPGEFNPPPFWLPAGPSASLVLLSNTRTRRRLLKHRLAAHRTPGRLPFLLTACAVAPCGVNQQFRHAFCEYAPQPRRVLEGPREQMVVSEQRFIAIAECLHTGTAAERQRAARRL